MIQSILTHAMPSWLSHQGPDNDVVISTRARLARNLAHHHFPHQASLYERAQIFEEVTEAVSLASGCGSFNAVSFCQLDQAQQQFMVEERLATYDLAVTHGQRGLIHDPSRRVSILVNEEDHIRMQYIDAGLQTQELWNLLDGIDDAIGMQVSYAFDRKRGYLTCSPKNAGTGLLISFLLHLPGLILTRTIDSVLQGASQLGVSTRGFFGGNSHICGSLFQLSNSAAIGLCESEFCDSTANVVQSIIGHERKARERLLAEARLELTDKIWRAYGILCNATLLTVDEFLNLSSALRLGIECNLFDKCTIDDLNRLTLFVLPAHCAICTDTDATDDTLKHARASLVSSFFARNNTENTKNENN